MVTLAAALLYRGPILSISNEHSTAPPKGDARNTTIRECSSANMSSTSDDDETP
jgi:hypothetical protein